MNDRDRDEKTRFRGTISILSMIKSDHFI